MKQKIGIYTETMAKVYAAQGHWEKAAEIYRYLLAAAPAQKKYADALAKAEKKINRAHDKNHEQLVPLFREWIELVFRHEKLLKLRKLRDKM